MGPRQGDDDVTPHTRPPADEDSDHMLVRTVCCIDGKVEVDLVCEPAFDYGDVAASWTMVDGERHAADASGAGQTIRLQTDMSLGIEGGRVRARHALSPGDKVFCGLSWAKDLAASRPGSGAGPVSPPCAWRSWHPAAPRRGRRTSAARTGWS
jgi:alpha,alpha-trehalase